MSVKPDSRGVWLRHQVAAAAFRKLGSDLGTRGVVTLPVKGFVTARILYRDIASRPMADLDLRMRPRDFSRARRVAREQGWVERIGPTLWSVVWTVNGFPVDIKCALGTPGLCAISVDDLLLRAYRCTGPLGFPHLEPELNDHALILVLNALKDGLRPKPWSLEDLRRIVRHERFDADTLVKRAREGRVASAVWIVADWLAKAHDVFEWGDVRNRIGARPPSERAARMYAQWQRMGSPPKPGLFVVASASDDPWRAVAGIGYAAAGVARSRALRAAKRIAGGRA